MRRSAGAVVAALGLALGAGPAFASAPNTLTYQGRLIESGVPASGSRMVEIHLCPDVLTILASCFSTGNQGVTAASGLFRTTFTIPSAVNLGVGVWWLNVSVGGTSLSPREQLTSSPFAAFASTASALGSPLGTTVYVSSNVGINTPYPGALLHVVGTAANQARVLVESSVASGNPGMIVKANTPAGNAFLLLDKADSGGSGNIDFSETGVNKWQFAFRDSAFLNRLDVINFQALSGPQMTFATDARVGIGNGSPAAKLHISTTSALPGELMLAVSTGPASMALKVQGDGMVAVSTRLAIGKNGTMDALDVEFGGDTGLRLNNVEGGPASIRLFINGTKRTFIEAAPADSYMGTPATENLHLRTNGQSRVFVNGASGRVGIGTTSPSVGSLLEVFGGSATVSALQVNNGGHVFTTGATPAVSAGCGTGSTVTGTDVAGRIALGSAALGTCTITFVSPYVSPPVCVVNNVTTGAAGSASTAGLSFTLVPFSGSLSLSETWSYICIGL